MSASSGRIRNRPVGAVPHGDMAPTNGLFCGAFYLTVGEENAPLLFRLENHEGWAICSALMSEGEGTPYRAALRALEEWTGLIGPKLPSLLAVDFESTLVGARTAPCARFVYDGGNISPDKHRALVLGGPVEKIACPRPDRLTTIPGLDVESAEYLKVLARARVTGHTAYLHNGWKVTHWGGGENVKDWQADNVRTNKHVLESSDHGKGGTLGPAERT
ncbi:hypothetical protein [Streptomyces sp. NPDC089795]|uniref:hypothetical protein n=1 Tax=Streptomyces sp. NPDC089795 TaxID=3155297 RepID=UPI00341C2E96